MFECLIVYVDCAPIVLLSVQSFDAYLCFASTSSFCSLFEINLVFISTCRWCASGRYSIQAYGWQSGFVGSKLLLKCQLAWLKVGMPDEQSINLLKITGYANSY